MRRPSAMMDVTVTYPRSGDRRSKASKGGEASWSQRLMPLQLRTVLELVLSKRAEQSRAGVILTRSNMHDCWPHLKHGVEALLVRFLVHDCAGALEAFHEVTTRMRPPRRRVRR